jgi:hypothetical protein
MFKSAERDQSAENSTKSWNFKSKSKAADTIDDEDDDE